MPRTVHRETLGLVAANVDAICVPVALRLTQEFPPRNWTADSPRTSDSSDLSSHVAGLLTMSAGEL